MYTLIKHNLRGSIFSCRIVLPTVLMREVAKSDKVGQIDRTPGHKSHLLMKPTTLGQWRRWGGGWAGSGAMDTTDLSLAIPLATSNETFQMHTAALPQHQARVK